MNSEITMDQNYLALYESELKGSSLISVVAYLRVASYTQGDDSPLESGVQASAIRRLCEEKFPEGCRIIWVTDKGASGNTPWQRAGHEHSQYRPGLTLVTQLIERGYVRYVCVERLHRLTRSPKLWLEFKEKYLDRYDVQLLSAAEPVEVAKGDYNSFVELLVSDGSCIRCQISQAAHHGLHNRLADGYPLGKPPYGWQCQDRRKLKSGQRIGIEPVHKQAAVVRQIWDRFLAGQNTADIAEELNQMRVCSPSGKHKWSVRTILRILKNPLHCGLILGSKGEYVRGEHFERRIIDESLFARALDRLSRMRRRRTM